MTEQEIIQAWKENKYPWKFVSDEMKEFAKDVARKDFVVLLPNGNFASIRKHDDNFIGDEHTEGSVYRLREDYEPEKLQPAQWIRDRFEAREVYRVKGSLIWNDKNGMPITLARAVTKGCVGFVFEGGRI